MDRGSMKPGYDGFMLGLRVRGTKGLRDPRGSSTKKAPADLRETEMVHRRLVGVHKDCPNRVFWYISSRHEDASSW